MSEFHSWFPSPMGGSFFLVIFCLWAASELYNRFASHRGLSAVGAQTSDRGSFWVVALVVWGSMAISFFFRVRMIGVFHGELQYLGLAMALFGIGFREWAVVSLGRFFSVVVATAPTQTLVTRGPYRWVRHPAYTGTILTLTGVPLALGTWLAAMLVLVICVAGFLYRVRVEERVLLEKFGDEYRAYIGHTWRFLPGI